MYDRVVIAVDGSEEAKQAARRGLALAQSLEAAVDVLYVIEQRALRLTQTAEEEAQLREHGEKSLTTIEDLAGDFDLTISTTLTRGKPAVEISEFADERNAGLIVVGRQGMTGLGKRLLGGVTERILHLSDVPVFVSPLTERYPEGTGSYDRLLLPTDGSENAEAAVPHSVAIAKNNDSVVHVLHVVDLQAAAGVFDAGGIEPAFLERLETEGQEAVDSVARDVRETDSELVVRTAVTKVSASENAAIGIREYARQHEIELIVMGSHGRSNLRRQLIGSVASTVLRTVDVPVLVVKRSV